MTSSCLLLQERQIYVKTTSLLFPSPEVYGYTMGSQIGDGSYGRVHTAWSTSQKKLAAIKTINKSKVAQEYLDHFFSSEISILSKLQHPNILHTYHIVETEKICYYIMELCENGDLLEYIRERRYLPEAESRFLFIQICEAVLYCHRNEVAHRDLKCENVMLDKNMNAKLGDFGYALDLQKSVSTTPCGSKSYAAPELLFSNQETFDAKKTDVWSLGVILYATVTGHLPFGRHSKELTERNIRNVVKYPDYTQSSSKHFISSIFTINPAKRLSISNLLISWWCRRPCYRPPPKTTQRALCKLQKCAMFKNV